MLPTEELFVYVYVLVHDLMLSRAVVVPGRPGPAPACSDAELLAIAVVRHLLGRRSRNRRRRTRSSRGRPDGLPRHGGPGCSLPTAVPRR